VGVDVAGYWFKARKFASEHPGVALENKPVAHVVIALVGRFDLLPGNRLGPFLGAALGASRLTEAVYQEVIDSVRVTYFSIPGRTRLTAAVLGGADFKVNRWFAVTAEVRLTSVIHDPDAGFMVTLRGGFRFMY
jgi:hypothetical protein